MNCRRQVAHAHVLQLPSLASEAMLPIDVVLNRRHLPAGSICPCILYIWCASVMMPRLGVDAAAGAAPKIRVRLAVGFGPLTCCRRSVCMHWVFVYFIFLCLFCKKHTIAFHLLD